jgi:hypothetical protein
VVGQDHVALFFEMTIDLDPIELTTLDTMNKLLLLAVFGCVVAIAAATYELPQGVYYNGPLFVGYRGRVQRAIFSFAEAYTTCNRDKFIEVFDEDILFSYLFVRYNGLNAALADIDSFCVPSARPNNVSVFFEADGFAIDGATLNAAVKVQFRQTTQAGVKSVVNDIWFAKTNAYGDKFTEFTEWLSDSVRFLQQYGVLNYDESADPLLPWPTYVAGREGCARRVTHTCPDAPCQPAECTRV